jgi:hypothetical protein
VNIAFGGRIMSDVSRNVEDVLAEVLDELYKPRTPEAAKKLVQIFQLAEDAYCANMNYDTDGVHLKGLPAYPGPGELHIGVGIGLAAGASAVPVHLLEPNLSDQGRALYAKGLETCLKSAYEIEDKCGDKTRIGRLKECILHALDDVTAVAYARGTAKQG